MMTTQRCSGSTPINRFHINHIMSAAVHLGVLLGPGRRRGDAETLLLRTRLQCRHSRPLLRSRRCHCTWHSLDCATASHTFVIVRWPLFARYWKNSCWRVVRTVARVGCLCSCSASHPFLCVAHPVDVSVGPGSDARPVPGAIAGCSSAIQWTGTTAAT